MERQEIYDRISAAKTALIPTHADGATVDTETPEDAARQYEKTVRNLFGTDPATGKLIAPSDPALVIAAVQTAGTVATLRKRARSLRYAALKALSALLKLADRAQRAGNWHEVERIVSLNSFHVFTVLAQMMPTDYRQGWEPIRRRHGKKSSLLKLPKDWRKQMADEVHGQFRIPAIVALLTGCRPAELEKGVLIERVGDHLYATIHGAKVTDKAGQEQRRFRIADHPVTNLLIGIMTISDETRDAMTVKVECGNSVTTHLRSVGKKLWPKRKETITIYTARHAMAADCKAAIHDGADPDMVSQVLGHVVDKTASYYGARFQSGGISVAPTDVVVPKAIKQKVRERNHQRAVERGLLKDRRRVHAIP